jgi:hypothetical protein
VWASKIICEPYRVGGRTHLGVVVEKAGHVGARVQRLHEGPPHEGIVDRGEHGDCRGWVLERSLESVAL